MELDYIDAQREKRKMLFFGGIIALIVAVSVVYYFWGNLINRGTIIFTGNAPFSVEFFERGETFDCPNSPCKITQSMGVKSFSASKEGYGSIVENVNVKLWGTVEESIDFAITPHFEKVDQYPEITEQAEYKFVFDEQRQMQKLVKIDDQTETAIVYFPRKIAQPEIYGVGNIVLVIDKAEKSPPAYKVDVKNKSKQLISDSLNLTNMTSGRWSSNGKYFVFSLLRQPGLWLMDSNNNVKEINANADVQQTVWQDNRLLVVEKNVTDDGEFIGYSFGYYYPDKDVFDPISLDQTLQDRPQNLVSVNEGKEVYFQAGESIYKLTLE